MRNASLNEASTLIVL